MALELGSRPGSAWPMTRWMVGKAPAQPALERVDQVVHRADRERRIDAAVKIDDLAVGGLAHAHVVDLAEVGDFRGERQERVAHFADARRRGVAAGQHVGRQRLDMGFDLDVRAELVAHRLFEPGRGVVRGGERLRAVDFKIGRHRQAAAKSSARRRDGWRGRDCARSP